MRNQAKWIKCLNTKVCIHFASKIALSSGKQILSLTYQFNFTKPYMYKSKF